MLEILAAYLFFRCYVATAPSTTWWSWSNFQVHASTVDAESCLADFKSDVERVRTSETLRRWYWWVRPYYSTSFDNAKVQAAAQLTQQQLDLLLAEVRESILLAAGKK